MAHRTRGVVHSAPTSPATYHNICAYDWSCVRNDREEFAANIGGYTGAPILGEFAFMLENHTGQSGPRHELEELLEWLAGRRKIQRMLGTQIDRCYALALHTDHTFRDLQYSAADI